MPHEKREVIVGLIRHYWQYGDNAVWRVGAGVPEAVVEGVKKDYALLSATRPSAVVYGDWKVLLHYEEENDRYGRNATALSAAAIPSGVTAEFEARVRLQLAESERDALHLVTLQEVAQRAAPIFIKREDARDPHPREHSREARKGGAAKVILIAGVALAIGLIGTVWLFTGQQPGEVEVVAESSPTPDAPEANGASAFCEDWHGRIRETLYPPGGGPANCLTQDAIALCGAPRPSDAPAFLERISGHHAGYCALYRGLSPAAVEAGLRQDLASMVSMGRLASRDAEEWGADVLGLPTRSETVVLPPLADQPDHRRIEKLKAGGFSFPGFSLDGSARLRQDWNTALPTGLKVAHAVADDTDMAATGAAYLKDYCDIVLALTKVYNSVERDGLPDPLMDGVARRLAAEKIVLAEGENPCVKDGEPIEIKFPDAALVITRAADMRSAIARLVTIVDFCALVPDLADLRRRGLSPLVHDCEGVARVMGVDWK